mgnify:CR=1 FL=1
MYRFIHLYTQSFNTTKFWLGGMHVMYHSTYSEELCLPNLVKQQLPISIHNNVMRFGAYLDLRQNIASVPHQSLQIVFIWCVVDEWAGSTTSRAKKIYWASTPGRGLKFSTQLTLKNSTALLNMTKVGSTQVFNRLVKDLPLYPDQSACQSFSDDLQSSCFIG